MGENEPDVPSFTNTLGRNADVKEREPDAQSCSASQQVVVAAMSNKYTAKCADGREVGVIAMIANGMCTATRLSSS